MYECVNARMTRPSLHHRDDLTFTNHRASFVASFFHLQRRAEEEEDSAAATTTTTDRDGGGSSVTLRRRLSRCTAAACSALALSAINIFGGFEVAAKTLNLFRRPDDPPEFYE